MNPRKFEVIQELMQELESMMEPTADELGERIGKPKVAIAIEAKGDESEMEPEVEGIEEMLGGYKDEEDEMEEMPGAMMKKRIMEMRRS
jgi:hypothetical protein